MLLPLFHKATIYCPLGVEQMDGIEKHMRSLGYTTWTGDSSLQLRGQLHNESVTTHAFSRSLHGFLRMDQLELITYSGPSKQTRPHPLHRGAEPYLSHMSAYAKLSEVRDEWDVEPYHSYTTGTHEALVYNTSSLLGFDIQFIERVMR